MTKDYDKNLKNFADLGDFWCVECRVSGVEVSRGTVVYRTAKAPIV